jgi:DNA-nicking Smr family endonuclease
VAKRKKHDEKDDDAPRPPPAVGTSLKALLKGVDLSKGDAKPSGASAKASAPVAKPSGASAKHKASVTSSARGTGSGSGSGSATSTAPAAEKLARPSDTLRGDDRIAFYDAIAGVRSLDHGRPARPQRAVPIKTQPAVRVPRESLDAPARKKLGELVGGAHRFDVAIEEDGFLEALRTDAPIEALGALRVAEPRIDATLDLHGLREADVEDRCARWIREQHRKGARRVRIVHGKGLHSPHGIAVLRDAVRQVLEASVATPLVLAFSSAPPSMGGTGATLVELTRDKVR